jgi:hypothetical protein
MTRRWISTTSKIKPKKKKDLHKETKRALFSCVAGSYSIWKKSISQRGSGPGKN